MKYHHDDLRRRHSLVRSDEVRFEVERYSDDLEKQIVFFAPPTLDHAKRTADKTFAASGDFGCERYGEDHCIAFVVITKKLIGSAHGFQQQRRRM